MTPLQIEILFHYNSRTVDYRDGDFSAPAVREAIDWFNGSADVLELDKSLDDKTYCLTAKGQFYIDYLCDVPLPLMKFEMSSIRGKN